MGTLVKLLDNDKVFFVNGEWYDVPHLQWDRR